MAHEPPALEVTTRAKAIHQSRPHRENVSACCGGTPKTKQARFADPICVGIPSYHRILVKHCLIEKNLPISDAYKVFLKVGADPEVEKLRRKVERGSKIKHVPALYLPTAMALQGMTKHELDALKLRTK